MIEHTPTASNAPPTVAQRFDAAASTYDQAANVQQRVAQKLFDLYASHAVALDCPPEQIVEAGCGTGFLTQHLCQHLCQYFPATSLLALDIAPGMITQCHHRLAHYPQVTFQVGNAEHLQLHHKADILISSFCLQWLSDWRKGLTCWSQQAQTLAFSVPLAGSFNAWTAAHARAGQRAGLHPLPAAQALQKHCAQLGKIWHFSIEHETQQHENALDFARTLRAIGAHQPRMQHRPAHLRRVLHELPNGIEAEYHVAYCIVECA